MPPNSKSKRRASSRSRTRSTESEEKKVEEHQEEEEVQPQDQDQNMHQAEPQPEVEDVLPQEEMAEEPDANPPELNRQNSTHTVVQINTKLPNISTLDKKLVILTHGNFTEWHACIQDIAYFRNWADCVLHSPWNGREEANQAINQQRRDAYWVLKNSIPLRTDYHHLAIGLRRGDAHALYTKIHKLFLEATAKNRGKIREEFYQLSMASTKLNVTKFAAKVVQLAEDLEAVGGKLDQDEVVTRFLSGLSKKFDQIVTVENVSKNPFDITLKNVVSFADDNNLLEYRETSVHGHYHMAKDTKASSSFNPPRSKQDGKRKPHYKKKVKPSPQYKRWASSSSSSNFGSSGGSGQQRQSTFQHQQRNPSHTQRRVNFSARDTRTEQKYEQKHDNHTPRAPYLCMMRAESVEQAAPEPVTHQVPTVALSTEIRKLIDLVVVKHIEHIYNRLNTLKNNATQDYNNHRDIANQNIDAINKLKLRVDQFNDKVSKQLPEKINPTSLEEGTTKCSFETGASNYSYLCMAQDIGRERVENKHDQREELPVLERVCIYPGCNRPCYTDQHRTHDYCGRINPCHHCTSNDGDHKPTSTNKQARLSDR